MRRGPLRQRAYRCRLATENTRRPLPGPPLISEKFAQLSFLAKLVLRDLVNRERRVASFPKVSKNNEYRQADKDSKRQHSYQKRGQTEHEIQRKVESGLHRLHHSR